MKIEVCVCERERREERENENIYEFKGLNAVLCRCYFLSRFYFFVHKRWHFLLCMPNVSKKQQT